MKKELTFVKNINILGIEIKKSMLVTPEDMEIHLSYEFTYKGISCRIAEWGYTEKGMSKYHGFGETMNFCGYIEVPLKFAKLRPETGEYDYGYAYNLDYIYEHINVGGETYQDNNGTVVTTGWDYQHSHNNYGNTDLLSVLEDLITAAGDVYLEIN